MQVPVAVFAVIFALIRVLFSAPVLAGPPEDRQGGTEGWQTVIEANGQQRVCTYYFLPNQVVVELTKHLTEPVRYGNSFGFYEKTGDTVVIRWQRLRNNKLVHTATETAELKQSEDRLTWSITDHTEKSQVGRKMTLQLTATPEAVYDMVLELARVMDRLRQKQEADQQLIDVYEQELQRQKDAVDALVR